MWTTGILAARNLLGNKLALENGGQDESSSTGGDCLVIEEVNEYASMFADRTIYAPSPDVTVVPVPAPVLLGEAEAPLPFTGPIKLVRSQGRDLGRPLVQTASSRLPPGRILQHGQGGRRGMLQIRNGAEPTASSAAAAQQDGDAPRKLSVSRKRKRRKKAQREAVKRQRAAVFAKRRAEVNEQRRRQGHG